ncbi:hypothetical protein DSO57_1008070 [Entomophthora muscae]|uniref:Uncharacterized protein n=1 Tax=Entomophthora muscae TaxID=34485 RepID=A0ACC2S985_9FUNG|nr:hypothetical protein DSO57_1008070 [Entomophthora muscae]
MTENEGKILDLLGSGKNILKKAATDPHRGGTAAGSKYGMNAFFLIWEYCPYLDMVGTMPNVVRYVMGSVNSLPPLALDRSIFPCCTKKGPKTPAKPLHLLNDLAHTVDERFVLAYSVESLPLVAPSWEETLVNLDYLLAWCCPFLKTIRATQSGVATSTLDNPVDPQMSGISSSQSDLILEIGVKLSSPPESIQQSFVPSQSGSPPTVM